MTELPNPSDPRDVSGKSSPRGTVRRRSYLAAVAHRTLDGYGAKIGLAWLLVVGFCAVFGPLLASSHPLLLKSATGEITSPWLRYLTPADVAIPIILLAALGLLFLRRWHVLVRWVMLLLFAVAVGAACWQVIDPPQVRVFDQYRVGLAEERLEWAVHTPIPYSPSDRLHDRPQSKLAPPGSTHWLGTTINGEDLLSRMIHASRIAMSVGFIATGIALVIGVIVGGAMGYFSRWADLLGMRLVEIFEAIPSLYLLLTFVAFFPRNLYIMMAIIGLTGWTGYARFVRAEFLKLRQQDFVQAARAYGAPLHSVLFKHMLPNGLAPVLVSASFGVASAILAEAFLSFLGLGLVDEPSWGQMLSQAVGSSGGFVWWMALFPGLAIFLTVFAYNLIGEALRDAIDPKVVGTAPEGENAA